jgi:hypothetical protein
MTGMAMVAFLSSDWLAALGNAIAASLRADLDISIALGQIVTDVTTDVTPAAGDVRYTLLIGPGSSASVVTGSTDEAEVVLTTSYVAATALARGDTTAASLLEQGRVKISGDARRLVEASELLLVIGEAVTQLRDRTVFV